MNPLSKLIRSRKAAKGTQQPQPQQNVQQQPAEAPRPLDESELKMVGGGGSTSATTKNDTLLPKGKW